jgi:hypothetical protein
MFVVQDLLCEGSEQKQQNKKFCRNLGTFAVDYFRVVAMISDSGFLFAARVQTRPWNRRLFLLRTVFFSSSCFPFLTLNRPNSQHYQHRQVFSAHKP